MSQENSKSRESYVKMDVSITASPFFENQGFKVVKENLNVVSNQFSNVKG
jgi:hypothetical protein